MPSDESDLPLACNFDAIPADERESHQALSAQLFGTVMETEALSDGYGFRLPSDSATLRQVVDFVANERLCCPFLRFEMVVEPGSRALWLRLSGQAGVRQFLEAEILSH